MPASNEWIVTLDKVEHRVTLEADTVSVDGRAIVVDAPYIPGQRLIEAMVDDAPLAVRVEKTRAGWRFVTRGAAHNLRVLTPHVAELARHMIEKIPPDLSRFLLCPMPVADHRDQCRRRRQGRGRSAARRGRGDEDGEYPARDQGGDDQVGRGQAGEAWRSTR